MNAPVDIIIRLLFLIPQFIILLLLIAAAWFVLRVIRSHLTKPEFPIVHYLESFQKHHEQGNLSDEEYRLIQRLVILQTSRTPDDDNNPDYSILNKTAPR